MSKDAPHPIQRCSDFLAKRSGFLKLRGFTIPSVLGLASFLGATGILLVGVATPGGKKPIDPLKRIGSSDESLKNVAKKPSFSQDILPIMKAHCTMCHSPKSTSGGLDLSTAKGLLKGGISGRMVVPNDPKKSILLERILGHGGKQRMPMGFAPLSSEQNKVIETWISQGADFTGGTQKKHWAYVAPVETTPPSLANTGWGRNAIDAFVYSKMLSEGIKPSPRASNETLLRRLALDLTGLPPTDADRKLFLADTSQAGYEELVDRLLASPKFGEHFASKWLDLARYADSNGYEKDLNRTIWPFRDYVIRSYNADLPFDQFTIEQLAGDLLPNPTESQLIATGFHRNTMQNEEGGVDAGEARWLTLVDRVGTTGSVWLGSTVACAQCHDHKYDPISHEDFFKMLAYFEPADEPVLTVSNSTIKTMILRDNKAKYPAQTLFREKGAYLSPGKTIFAGTLSTLPPAKLGTPKTRLGLAQWLVSRENPLTARVQVNRYWAHLFGIGLVKTEEDFGTQGERPIHKELLDWLAVEFMEKGWSTKKLLKLIVSSSTYQQSSKVSPELIEKDPQNRLLARGPRFRISAEMIRDYTLAVTGLLSNKLGGPSVFPDQPAGIWNIPYSGETWQLSQGEDRYRRGIYTFWKRSSPYPMFTAFDASSREFCTTQRIRTNTPLQALASLNNEVTLKAADNLAADLIKNHAHDFDQVKVGFRRILVRDGSPSEIENLLRFYRRQVVRIKSEAPDKKTEEVNLRALSLVCQVLLNLDEALTKE